MPEYAAEDLLALQAGTLLALISEVLLKGEFVPAPEEPVADHEKVIGELTLFEKAIYTAKKSIVDDNNAMVREIESRGEEPDKLEVIKNKIDYKALNALFWACIKNRLGTVTLDPDAIGVWEGYKIVSFSLPDNPFLRMLASINED